MNPTSTARRWSGPPLALQITALLLGGLVVAQLVTLALTMLLPPQPPPQYELADIARILAGEQADPALARILQRVVRSIPPQPSGPGWLTSERSRHDLARLLGRDESEVRLYFYTPLPFAGTAAPPPPGLSGAAAPDTREHARWRVPAAIDAGWIRVDYQVAQAGPGPGGGRGPAGGFGAPGGFPPGGGLGNGMGNGIGNFPGGGFGPSPSRVDNAAPPSTLHGASPNGLDSMPGGNMGHAPSAFGPAANSEAPVGPLAPATSLYAPGLPGGPGIGPIPGLGGLNNPALPSAAALSQPALPAAASVAGHPTGFGAADAPAAAHLASPRPHAPASGAAVDHVPAAPAAPPSGREARPAASAAPTPQESPGVPDTATAHEEAPAAPAAAAAPNRAGSPPPAAVEARVLAQENPAPAAAPARGLFGLSPAPFVVGDFIAAMRLPQGGWATVQPVPEPFPNAWQRRVLLWFLVASLVVAPVGWWFSRRLVRPIAGFARAAEQLGRDPQAPVLALEGPAEVGRAAQAFNRMQSRMRSFVDDRTAMIGAISHDMRTPLTRMRFRIEDVPEALQAGMLSDVEEMEQMITSVLSFIRDASEPGARERLDLSSIVEDVVEDAVFVGKDVRLERSEEAAVDVDAIGMRRVLDNLVENAVKYGNEARVRLFVDREDAVAEVSDSGPGLSDGELERVFEPFYRAPAARASGKQGSGLGLAVCRSIARAHGGDVQLRRGASGMVAQVRLPLAIRFATVD